MKPVANESMFPMSLYEAFGTLTIDYAAIFSHKTLYSNGAKHLIDEIMGDGSPASPAHPGRRHVA
jgi:hypothetical protein